MNEMLYPLFILNILIIKHFIIFLLFFCTRSKAYISHIIILALSIPSYSIPEAAIQDNFVHRIENIFQEAISVPRTNVIFPGYPNCSSNRSYFFTKICLFEQKVTSILNTQYFFLKAYFFIEHMNFSGASVF